MAWRWRWVFPYGFCIAAVVGFLCGVIFSKDHAAQIVCACAAVVFAFILGANVVWAGHVHPGRP